MDIQKYTLVSTYNGKVVEAYLADIHTKCAGYPTFNDGQQWCLSEDVERLQKHNEFLLMRIEQIFNVASEFVHGGYTYENLHDFLHSKISYAELVHEKSVSDYVALMLNDMCNFPDECGSE